MSCRKQNQAIVLFNIFFMIKPSESTMPNFNKIDRFSLPDERGRFGPYGGSYVPETLSHPLSELTAAYLKAKQDPAFQEELAFLLRTFAGRPTELYFAERLTKEIGGAQIYLKREDLLHTGAHKINNALGQALLAKRMGKTRIIAETGAGQHGIATASVCAHFGFECVIYMGAEDMRRQALNVFRMRLSGAEVRGVEAGSKTLKEAINEAMRDWVTNVDNTHYIIGTVAGPHPYPMVVRDFASIIGQEARAQMLEQEQPANTYLNIPKSMHSPIRQDAVQLKLGADNQAATDFMHYLASARAQKIISSSGFATDLNTNEANLRP